MKKIHWLGLLMVITILGSIAFQLYWLRQNYDREKRSLSLRTDASFRQTMLQLQVEKMQLDGINWSGKDSLNGKFKIVVRDNGEQVNMHMGPQRDFVSTIRVIRDKVQDTLKIKAGAAKDITISMNDEGHKGPADSLNIVQRKNFPKGRSERLFDFLYDVDSLQQPLRITEIDSAVSATLAREKLAIPFTIIKKEGRAGIHEPVLNEINIGFAKPVIYQLQLGNTMPYLFRQITQPILFSLFLLGITILSFVLLYKNLLKQHRLAALKNEFISNVTHELKTPIATVGVAIEALKNFNAIQDTTRTQEYLDISQNELQRLSLLVDKVLRQSMFEKKEMDLKIEPVDLKVISEEVVSSMRLQLEKQQAIATVTTEGSSLMQGDKHHLQAIVFNLVDNALKYSSTKPTILINLKEQAETLQITVTDNGIGIPAAYTTKIFEKFFRVPHGDTHNAKGYGLGLSYVAQVIKQHKGTITVHSKPGEGTTFTINLPKNF